jgi:hypothetical protein
MTTLIGERSIPPNDGTPGRPALWPARLAPCLEEPGEWFLVWRYFSSASAACAAKDLRRPSYRRRVPPGRWEFRHGQIDDLPEWGVWARYLGADE